MARYNLTFFKEILEVLHKAVNVVSFQIRHGANLLAMERITGCDLNLRYFF